MGAIKHALILGEELAEMIGQYLDGESEATKSMALETAIRHVVPDEMRRIVLAEAILEVATWEQQFDDSLEDLEDAND